MNLERFTQEELDSLNTVEDIKKVKTKVKAASNFAALTALFTEVPVIPFMIAEIAKLGDVSSFDVAKYVYANSSDEFMLMTSIETLLINYKNSNNLMEKMFIANMLSQVAKNHQELLENGSIFETKVCTDKMETDVDIDEPKPFIVKNKEN